MILKQHFAMTMGHLGTNHFTKYGKKKYYRYDYIYIYLKKSFLKCRGKFCSTKLELFYNFVKHKENICC